MTGDERDRALTTFLDAYNAKHGSDYSLSSLIEEPASDLSCDYLFSSPAAGDLKVQWTRAGMSGGKRSSLHRWGDFLDRIRDALDRKNSRGCGVLLTVKAPPQRKPNRLRVAEQIAELIMKSRHPQSQGVHISQTELARITPGMGEVLHRIVIKLISLNIPTSKALISVAYMGVRVPRASEHAEQALARKRAKYGPSAHDLVLVIHLDMGAYDDDEVSEIVERLGPHTQPFREVWVLRTGAQARADRCDKWETQAV